MSKHLQQGERNGRAKHEHHIRSNPKDHEEAFLSFVVGNRSDGSVTLLVQNTKNITKKRKNN